MMGFTEGVLTLQTYQSISLMCGNQHAQVSCKLSYSHSHSSDVMKIRLWLKNLPVKQLWPLLNLIGIESTV